MRPFSPTCPIRPTPSSAENLRDVLFETEKMFVSVETGRIRIDFQSAI